MGDSVAARIAAVEAIGCVLSENRMLTGLIDPAQQLDVRDRGFASRLAYGVLRWKIALDWVAGRLLSRPLRPRDRDIHLLLLTGLYQLWHEPGQDHAVVHATAECARHRDKTWAVGLVNAILRRFIRERELWLGRLADSGPAHAHPEWLVAQLNTDWPMDADKILAANNRQAPMWLRVNVRRWRVEEASDALQLAGFETTRHPLAPQAIAVSPPAAVTELPGFSEGRLSVQDPAAQLAAGLLAAEPGQRVLDACAAPGGKTGHLLETVEGLELTALDRDPQRLDRVRENLARLGLHCELRAADATETGGWWDGRPYDRILLDAPCSATGVIRRHPEIRHLRDAAQVAQAVADQRRLLEALWPLLDSGGILVYATCSVLRDENHEQIHRFLSAHPECSVLPAGLGDASGWQILPGQDDMDGFYYATLRKSD